MNGFLANGNTTVAAHRLIARVTGSNAIATAAVLAMMHRELIRHLAGYYQGVSS